MNRLLKLSARAVLGLSASLGLLLNPGLRANTVTWDFDNWSEGSATNLNLASFRDDTGLIYHWDYQQSFGGNPASGGFLQLTPAQNGRSLAVILPDIDNGAPVKAFKITADLRVGNGTNTPPADGFSINYVRDNDVALSNAVNVIINPGSPPWMPPIGLLSGYAGGDSAAQTLDPRGSGQPENGTKTGLSIVFDAYYGYTANWLPDTGPNGTPEIGRASWWERVC